MPSPSAADWAKYAAALVVGVIVSIPIAFTVLLDCLRGRLPASVLPPSAGPRPACLDDPARAGGRRVFFSAGGRLWSSLQAGSSSKPLLLLLHGFPENSYSWRHVLKHFAGRYHVVAIDLRGYGDTSRCEPSFFTRSEYALEALVEDVRAVATALQGGVCKPFHLAAHDWGGMVAWGYGHAHPDTLASLTIMNAPHPVSYEKNLSFSQVAKSWYIFFFQLPWLPEAFLARNGFSFIVEAFTGPRAGVRNKAAMSAEDVEAMRYGFTRAGTLTAALNYYRNVLTVNQAQLRSYLARTRKIPVPVHLLWGSEDAALGVELTRGTERMVTGAYKLSVIQGASHWVQNDAVEEVLAAMDAFYAAHGGSGGGSREASPAPLASSAAEVAAAPASASVDAHNGGGNAAKRAAKAGRKH